VGDEDEGGVLILFKSTSCEKSKQNYKTLMVPSGDQSIIIVDDDLFVPDEQHKLAG